jgi:hypothetical protein
LVANSAKRAGTDVAFMRIIFDSFYLVVFCLVLMSDERWTTSLLRTGKVKGGEGGKGTEKRPEDMRLVLNACENGDNS